MKKEISTLFLRDLSRLSNEINAYENEEQMWEAPKDISNSAGNLCLHITGNIQHFIGHVMGNSGYQRQREFEFSGKVEVSHLLSEIKAAEEAIHVGFEKLELEAAFPLEVLQRSWTNGEFLIHLYGHLNYHLGQINYHRRLGTS